MSSPSLPFSENSSQNDEIAVDTRVVQRNQQRKMQQREDDEEEWETRGRRANRAGGGSAGRGELGGGGGLGGMVLGAIGAAAMAFGAYTVYKSVTLNTKEAENFVESPEAMKQKLKEMEEDLKDFPVLGMDCQWRVYHDDIRNPVALLQLATHRGKIMLVQLQKVNLAQELRDLLLNPRIIKAGIEGIKDIRYLREDYQLEVRSSFDIRFLAVDTGNHPGGLKSLSESVLGLTLDRNWDTISSDWDQSPLEPDQIAYAEEAVKNSVDIFTKLFSYMEPAPTPQKVLDYCHSRLDRPYLQHQRN
jgi:3'-5' exonuclease